MVSYRSLDDTSTYHRGAYEDDKSRNGYGHLFKIIEINIYRMANEHYIPLEKDEG